MTNGSGELTSALRAVARDDAARVARVAPEMDARLLAEFRVRYPDRSRSRGGRWFGLAMAATLVSAIAVPMWIASRGAGRWFPEGQGSLGAGGSGEVSTAFLPLPYSGVPMSDGQVVRIEVPRAALATFGLLPVDSVSTEITGTVLADVIVGEDGLARAVRFVRAPTARTE
ncbi:MAG TPA: hypothetical protein VGY48_20880 [Vicinamibacterales bacterium]|jgi:hypothetical protein|nr:hypothetical protein [Vicinamibacterales bacterium]